ncbi:MAG TPA: siderophore-interacting protein [Polyangiales bacterium]
MSEAPKRTPPRLIEVLDTQRLSPGLLRISFGGPALAGFGPGWPAAHIKLFFPRAHQSVPQLPRLSPEGRPIWPEPPDSPAVRTYSLRRHDPARHTVEVDFVLHDPGGPASEWALRARPGMQIGIAGPGGPRPLLPRAPWVLMAGDLSALPAISALLETMHPETRGQVWIQLDDQRDRQPLTPPPGVQLFWLIAPPAAATAELREALRAQALSPQARFWLAGENAQVVALRDDILARAPEARSRMYAVPYWKRREAEEQYHAERHRVMDELDAP